ncbi:MAG: cell envelope integrity EipB family protein [Pseudolabrys sp.]|nr:cell envelope integrity EipB family protein [Pseudolabrys sp.]
MTLRLNAGRLLLPSLVVMAAGLVAVSYQPATSAPVAAPLAAGAAQPEAVVLVPHRAIYDLKLSKSSGSRGIQAVRGRIVYDFSGNACDGYELNFRQVSELDSGQGKVALSDLRSVTWEDGAAKNFRFNSENKLDDKQDGAVEGAAQRNASDVAIDLRKPKNRKFTVPVNAVFPTDHMRRILVAAREGKTILEFPVYDGSETGEKLYNTLTVIGRAIEPGQKPVTDAGAKTPELAKLSRWPVTISYFEKKDDKTEQTGEQTPVYAITFELYENGISRGLILDYNDFTIVGEMSSLEMKKEKPCK